FFLYSFLAVVISLVWAVMAENQMFIFMRDWSARLIFFFTLGFGFFGFCFQAGLMASRILVLEREKKSSSLIRIAPLRSWNLVFQKMVTPILVEWLFFLGILPVLSLVFLLGGVSPQEFAYHLMNLAVWTNTSILVGLRFSAYAKNTNKARGRTIGSILLLAFVLPLASIFFESLSGAFGLIQTPSDIELIFSEGFHQLANLAAPLEPISPVWMSASWYLGDTLPAWFFHDQFFFGWQLPKIFPACPAALSWILHTVFQVFLFLGAVKGWRLTTEEAESAVGFDKGGGVRAFFRWIKSGRAKRGFFLGSWRVFYDLEDRELFKKGRVSKLILLTLYILLLLGFLLFLVIMEDRSITEYGIIIFPITAAISLIASIGFAANSLRRERDRDCATFLLASPIEARSLFFGKWFYFISLALKGMFLGIAATLCWTNFTWPGRAPEQVFTWVSFCFIASWVPLLTGLSIYYGSRSKKGGSMVWRFLIPIVLYWGLGLLAVLFVELLDSYSYLEWLAEFIEWLVYIFLPWALLSLCGLYAFFGKNFFPSGGERGTPIRLTWIGLFILVLLVEMWAASLNQNSQFYYWGNESVRIADARIVGRWWAIPLALGFMLWVFIATRKKKWWLKTLVGKEQSL
ncbi:MAG: hypothetical protein KC964_22060, partial [Candidatus Omnitrophica bacterium]|nr:hypothetical protein [Candidatus Omnitrophota bacterium]